MVFLNSEEDMARFAADYARTLVSGDVVLLSGDLGAGKSVFARGVIRHLCDDTQMDVPSPTFTLVQTYEAPSGAIWHFDLYRLEEPDEIYETGWEEALSDGIVLVEWPERLGGLQPKRSKMLHITIEPDGRRRVDEEVPQ